MGHGIDSAEVENLLVGVARWMLGNYRMEQYMCVDSEGIRFAWRAPALDSLLAAQQVKALSGVEALEIAFEGLRSVRVVKATSMSLKAGEAGVIGFPDGRAVRLRVSAAKAVGEFGIVFSMVDHVADHAEMESRVKALEKTIAGIRLNGGM